ncbi:uncharacterized protein LOC132556541 [Ylistrum balloti]|uniref:uncharacterized protein LOC132556541 n=1 Tax=Ylistrum balloti TaxID=509963 RepID=UPI002905EC07|nr:uncharacterized protein LOC132556541 [Ylistrum balloti]
MDFSKFRESGDLSDITVITGGTEFRLHRFPLYAKSEYFVKVSRASPGDSNRVELLDFPGGADIFGIVADFCYNMKVDMTKNNIVQIRCAAEYLQMSGTGNLIEISDKFLHDTITSGKLSRSTGAITSLLLYCVTIGPLAEVAGIVEACSDAMVESWLKPPTKFTDPSNFKKQGSSVDKRDDKTMKGLCNLPLDWFVKLLTSARDSGVRPSLLADMATRYITLVLDRDESEKSIQDAGSKPGKENTEKSPSKADPVKITKKIDTGHVLDAVIMELPEDSFSDDVMTIDWITRTFKMATLRGCRCRRPLVKAAGEIMNKLAPDDLCIISPSLLRDIVQESCNDEGEAERACRIIDTYMTEMVRKGVLTGETFRLLASAAPGEARKSHDQLYGILEYVLIAERDKMSDDQRQELINRVNFTLVSEDVLHQALASEFIPPAHVAKGALALCARLKKDLEVMTSTVSKQDEELRRYNYSYKRGKVTTTPAPRSSYSSAPPYQRGGLTETDYEPTKDSDPLKVLDNMLSGTDRQTDEVLSSARNKLTSGAGTGVPFNSFRPVQSGEHDISFEEELEFKYDRAFRAMDNSRSKPRSGGYGYRSSFRY